MKLKDLGEIKLIERLTGRMPAGRHVVVGVGDDAAVLEFDRARYLLLTTDMLVENTHFTAKTSPELVGRKAIAVNISDIAAMGGVPGACTVSIGLPPKTDLAFVDRLYAGMRKICARYGVSIVGGDTVRSSVTVINVAMTGTVRKRDLLLRSGAEPGDAIFVTGSLGRSILGKHLKFTPRVHEVQKLLRSARINSMIDISDGLSTDLNHIARSSRVGAMIFEERIPVSKPAIKAARDKGVKPVECALNDGEDFEMLFTLSPAQALRLSKLKPRLKMALNQIGIIVPKQAGVKIMTAEGIAKPLIPRGFDHLA